MKKVFRSIGYFLYSSFLLTRYYINYLKSLKNDNKFTQILEFNFDFLREQNHKKFFILGTGDSINQITGELWSDIKKNISVGINEFLIHDFIPDFYSIETPGIEEAYLSLISNLINKVDLIRDTRIMIRNGGTRQFNIINLPMGLKYLRKTFMYIPINDEKTYTTSLWYLKFLRFMNLDNDILYVARTSVVMLILLAWQLGFKEIILCGIDMKNYKYFYHHNPEYYIEKGFKLKNNNVIDGPHPTAIKNNKYLDAGEIIRLTNENLLQKDLVKLSYVSNCSSLSTFLNEYEFQL